MPILQENSSTAVIELLHYTGSDGVTYPPVGSTVFDLYPGRYKFKFKSSKPLEFNQFWVKKVETLSGSNVTWSLNEQVDELDIDFSSGESTWITLGISSNFAEYLEGSKKDPAIRSSTIRLQILPGFIFVPPSNPAPSASNISIASQITGLKVPVIPVIFGTPTPTPSKRPATFYTPVVSKVTFSTSLDSVSPILDTHQLSYTVIKNLINHYNEVSLIDSESNINGGLSIARYITKPVKLLEDNMAAGFFISFAANIPEESNVYIFHKIFNTVEDQSLSTFEQQPWIFNASSGTRKSVDKNEFLDFEFSLNSISYPSNIAITQFDMFSIKIVMTSTNPSKVPKIKDFRVMAHS
mgnify:CR=1 FL=1